MTEDLEIISLKILKILYHYHQQSPGEGLDEEKIIERISFVDQKKGIQFVRKALSELRDQFLVRKMGDSEYVIGDRGLKHYERFKFIKSVEEELSSPANIVTHGGSHSIHNRYQHHTHNYHMYGESVTFPGDVQEFIQHHDDLVQTVEAIEKLVMDAPKGEEILNKLEQMKAILNQDSSGLKGKREWEDRLLKAIEKLEKKI